MTARRIGWQRILFGMWVGLGVGFLVGADARAAERGGPVGDSAGTTETITTRLIAWSADGSKALLHRTSVHSVSGQDEELVLVDLTKTGKDKESSLRREHGGGDAIPSTLSAVKAANLKALAGVNLMATGKALPGHRGKVVRKGKVIAFLLGKGAKTIPLGQMEATRGTPKLLGLEWGPDGKAVAFRIAFTEKEEDSTIRYKTHEIFRVPAP